MSLWFAVSFSVLLSFFLNPRMTLLPVRLAFFAKFQHNPLPCPSVVSPFSLTIDLVLPPFFFSGAGLIAARLSRVSFFLRAKTIGLWFLSRPFFMIAPLLPFEILYGQGCPPSLSSIQLFRSSFVPRTI